VKKIVFVMMGVLLAYSVSDVFAQDAGAASQVFAPAPANAQQAPTFMQSLTSMLPMLAICYFIFYFMVLRPQETKAKKHKELLDSIKRGDSVVTTGGLIGRVSGVEKGIVVLEIAPNVKIKVEQAHIARFENDGASAEAA
jgi:preprotein translocase subunit YajC